MIGRLEAEGRDDLAAKLRKCGNPLVMRSICCGDVRMAETRCKNKWCPECARPLAAKRSAKMAQIVRTFSWPMFVTLTMKNVEDLTGDAVRELRRAFGRWRRMAGQRMIRGGLATIEVTNIGNGWHPHLHAVLDCPWLGPARLRPFPWEPRHKKAECYRLAKMANEEAWARALRAPQGTMHIKRTSDSSVTKEVVKYAVKGSDLVACRESIGQLIDCLTKTRLMTTFGSAHGFKFDESEILRPPCCCAECQSPAAWLPEDVFRMQFGRDQWRLVPELVR